MDYNNTKQINVTFLTVYTENVNELHNAYGRTF